MSQSKAEIAFFNNLAQEWWNLEGPQAMLHQINPLRVRWMERYVPLKGLKILDVGCGAGILAEALAKAGAAVTGIDLGTDLIKVAQDHAKKQGLSLNYRCMSVAEFAKENPAKFAAVACLEMLEHVEDFEAILVEIAKMLKPGGQVFLSTLNRNPRSFIEAIVGAEYLLKLIPKGTHHYNQFIRPDELCAAMRRCRLEPKKIAGLRYHPILKKFALVSKPQTNYWLVGEKSE